MASDSYPVKLTLFVPNEVIKQLPKGLCDAFDEVADSVAGSASGSFFCFTPFSWRLMMSHLIGSYPKHAKRFQLS
jgi:hypothetical protein